MLNEKDVCLMKKMKEKKLQISTILASKALSSKQKRIKHTIEVTLNKLSLSWKLEL